MATDWRVMMTPTWVFGVGRTGMGREGSLQ